MNRIYLDKKNIGNKFKFYQMIQTVINSYLFLIKVENVILDKRFRKDLYDHFNEANILGLYIMTDWIEDNVKIVFSLKSSQGENNFGSIEIELNKKMRK